MSKRLIIATDAIDNVIAVYQRKSTALSVVSGRTAYEISNHLGNVQAVISDKKVPVPDAQDPTIVAFYNPGILSATDYYPFGMVMPNRSVDTEKYRYGFNGQQKDDEIAHNESSGSHNFAEFWMYDTRTARRWNLDPKPHPSISMYGCFNSNPILFSDPFGDTVKYERFRDRVNSTLGRIFNKQFRENFKAWDNSESVYTISKNADFGTAKLVDAKPCHINCLDEGMSSERDQFAVYYNEGFGVEDISNEAVKVTVGFMRAPFEIAWKVGIKLPVQLLGLPYVGIRKLFNPNLNIGWGIGDNLQLPWAPGDHTRGWLSWGFGDYNDWNGLGMPQNKIRIGPHDALLGLRVGGGKTGGRAGGKGMPTQFIDFGQSLKFENWMWGYHFRINIWRKGMSGLNNKYSKKDDNIDFRSR